jgi:hypothetical protein
MQVDEQVFQQSFIPVTDGTYNAIWCGNMMFVEVNMQTTFHENIVFQVRTTEGVRGYVKGQLTIKNNTFNFDDFDDKYEKSDKYKELEDARNAFLSHVVKPTKLTEEEQQAEWEKCVASPYYFATKYLTLEGKPFTTQLTEVEYNRRFAELQNGTYSHILKRRKQ